MKQFRRQWPVIVVAMAALVAVPAFAGEPEEGEFEEAEIFFELNNTDGDLGIHGMIDGGPWKQLVITSPDKRRKLMVAARTDQRKQGMTELFFESAEPTFDELDPEDFFARFPEGEWTISGIGLEGEVLESTTEVSHVMAAPPGNVMISGVPAAEDCDADPLPSVAEPIIISWDPVTTSHPEIGEDGEIVVVKYELVIEQEDLELAMFINLPPDVTSFEIPSDWIALGEEFKFEILVREETGNQTAVESCFEID